MDFYVNNIQHHELVIFLQGIALYKSYYYYIKCALIVQELCESRGGRPGLSVLTSLLVSMDVKLY